MQALVENLFNLAVFTRYFNLQNILNKNDFQSFNLFISCYFHPKSAKTCLRFRLRINYYCPLTPSLRQKRVSYKIVKAHAYIPHMLYCTVERPIH